MSIRLRPLQLADEEAFLGAHRAMVADDFVFGLGYVDTMPWTAYLEGIEFVRRGADLPEGHVPATFLVADVGGEIVGRTSIRHELNEFLAREGGHIGYCVLPGHRRRGYATEILRQSLAVARALVAGPLLVTCDHDNVGSAAVIERCGGRFENAVTSIETGAPKRRYWFD